MVGKMTIVVIAKTVHFYKKFLFELLQLIYMNLIIFLTCTHMSSFGFLCILVTQSVQISRDRKFSRPWHHERVQFDLAQWAGPRWCVLQLYSHEWTSDRASGKVPDGKNLFYSCCYQPVCSYAYKK